MVYMLLGLQELIGSGHASRSAIELEISNFIVKLYMTIYHIKNSEQSIERSVRFSLEIFYVVLGMPVGQPPGTP